MTEYKLTIRTVTRNSDVTIPDEVQILDSTPHQSGVKLYLLEPYGEYDCNEETSDGETCSRTVNYPMDVCHQHE